MGCWEDWKQMLAMLAADIAFAAMNTMIKKVIDEGLNRLVIITYRQLVATIFMAPVAYFTERKTRPKLTAEIFVYHFFSAMLGASLTRYLFFLGLQYTSATFACAFLNMAPVFTFLIAIPFGLERLNLKSKAGIAKVLGTIAYLVGAMLLTFYKGIALTNTSNQLSELTKQKINLTSSCSKWMLGTIALFSGTFSWSSWFLLQSKVGKKYPALYSGTALIFFLSFLQAAMLSFSTQKGLSMWVLKRKVDIITIIFSHYIESQVHVLSILGLVGSGFGFLAMSWCVGRRGPVFTAAFSPLIQILVAGIDVSILHEQLHHGSILGSVLVIVGLYFLLWGKNKDAKSSSVVKPSEDNEEIHGPLSSV